MGRAIWSGVLSFGLVSVPVELYAATEAHGPVFHQFEEGTADRIRYQRVNERTGDEVDYSDIVVDLTEALQSSVQAARKGPGRKVPAKKKPDRRKTGSRKSA